MWEKMRNIIVNKLEQAGFLKRVGSDGEIKNRKEELKNAEKKEEDQTPEGTGCVYSVLFKWKMDEEELKNQVENYDALGFFSSACQWSA